MEQSAKSSETSERHMADLLQDITLHGARHLFDAAPGKAQNPKPQSESRLEQSNLKLSARERFRAVTPQTLSQRKVERGENPKPSAREGKTAVRDGLIAVSEGVTAARERLG